ncbi:unnamed protein product [Nippostrongylus brasiliensis]|uniref:Ion_trans_2 domain-containing protein n=1 Tax=Nippostrongylus brasiliensis TaxID=27835 RepID=A0A0N4YVK9_NIPBR|nr:unnamed protein product [Nippostrongylus brasiliensis]
MFRVALSENGGGDDYRDNVSTRVYLGSEVSAIDPEVHRCLERAIESMMKTTGCSEYELQHVSISPIDECYQNAQIASLGAHPPPISEDALEDEIQSELDKWSFGNSLLFSFSVITTIGYGHVAPVTFRGRLFCIIYGLIGVPVTLLTVADLGMFLSILLRKIVNCVYNRIIMSCGRRKWKPSKEAMYSDIDYVEEDEGMQVRSDEEMDVDWTADDDFEEGDEGSSLQKTLAPIGVREVMRVVRSVVSLTHSFTAMPVINGDGRLGEKLLVVLKGKNSVLPRTGHWQAPNLLVVAGTTHIMTKSQVPCFVKECVAGSSSPPLTILLVDSWAGFKDHANVLSQVTRGKEVRSMTIPAGATYLYQPLDVNFFRLFMRYIRRLHEYAIQHRPDFAANSRDGILKTYGQFCAPVFRQCLADAWVAAGYVDDHAGHFSTPTDYSFNEEEVVVPRQENDACSSIAFVRKTGEAVALCMTFVCYLLLGAKVVSVYEPEMDFFKAFYFNFVTLTTIGLGDFVPRSFDYLFITLCYIGVGLALTTMAIELAADLLRKLHYIGRKMDNIASTVVWFGGKKMTMKQLIKNLGDQFNIPEEDMAKFNLNEFVDNAMKVEAGEIKTLRVSRSMAGNWSCAVYEPEMDFFKAFYFNFVTLTTIGLGDFVPRSFDYLFITLCYIGVGLALTTMAIELAADLLRKLHYIGRKMDNIASTVVWFGGKKMTMKQLIKNLGDQFNIPEEDMAKFNLNEFVDNAMKVEAGEIKTLRVSRSMAGNWSCAGLTV